MSDDTRPVTGDELDVMAALRAELEQDKAMEANFRMLDEHPDHGWRIRLGAGLAEMEIRMEWFPDNGATVVWTDSAPCQGIPDSWFAGLIEQDADPRAAALSIAAALLDPRFATWEPIEDLDPDLEEEG